MHVKLAYLNNFRMSCNFLFFPPDVSRNYDLLPIRVLARLKLKTESLRNLVDATYLNQQILCFCKIHCLERQYFHESK